MNIENAIKLYNKIEQNKYAQNLFARANSRYILFGVNESKENFPLTLESNLNFGSNNLAFSYLSIGCCLFENNFIGNDENDMEIKRLALEKGAEFIEYNHYYEQNRSELSSYYLLISALAYYAVNQYSKSFVVMKKVDNIYQTDVSILTSAFLKKDFKKVYEILNRILLNEKYIKQTEYEQTTEDRIQVVLLAKALANLLDFIYFGDQKSFDKSKEILADLLELLEIQLEPSMWWVVRLFIIIVNGLQKSSLWTTILPIIPDNETQLTTQFIKNLIFAKNPIVELFVVQRKALTKVLSEKGAVVSLPTSSGKTRIAEIAILQCLVQNPDNKILYLAPFRSLAFEIENSFNQTFEKIGFTVSQLYGSGLYNQLDRTIIEEANILIATPEKAKVILRANDDIMQQIKLVIIDEGHLLNEQERQVRNEMFVEELKKYVQNNQGRIILLSAVLPNANEIAEWITQDSNSFILNNERVARQRLGILEYRNNKVNLEWQGEEKSYNPNFIKPFIKLTKKGVPQKNAKAKPSNKKEAVAHTALKLSVDNPLLIFIAIANSVLTYGKEVFKAMERTNDLKEHGWKNQTDWETFKLICEENKSKDNAKILKLARYGILCHKGNISQELKNIIERLMRTDKPRIIIATMTLGQGVNLGISTVIFGGVSFNNSKTKKWQDIDNKDFWNIVGRAGRAFTDTEGKVLFASENNEENEIALSYFKKQPENTLSGLLKQIKRIKKNAEKCNVDFDELLELIANNDFNTFTNWQNKFTKINIQVEFQDFFDWIDDTLLSLELEFENELFENIDDYFRQTLAYIQAKNYKGFKQADVIDFLKARCKAIKNMATNKTHWKSLISSGLPLASAIKLDNVINELQTLADVYLVSNQDINKKIELLKGIEEFMKKMPSVVFSLSEFTNDNINKVRSIWLSGKNIYEIDKIKDAQKICNKYFAYFYFDRLN